MKTMSVGKRRVWRRRNQNPEVWDCVKLKDMKRFDVDPLAYVSEHVMQSSGKSYFVYEAKGKADWEFKRREAMQKAEDVLDGVK